MSTEVVEAESADDPARQASGSVTPSPPAAGAKHMFMSTLTNYLQLATKIVAAMVLLGYNVRYLGEQDYAFWAWVWSVFSVVFLLDFGLGFSLARFIPPLHREGKIREIRESISAVFWLFSIAGVIIFAAGALGAYLLPNVFEVFQSQYRVHFLLFSIFMGVNFPTSVFRDSLFALQRITLRNMIGIVVDICTLVLVMVLYRASYGWFNVGFGLGMIVVVMGTSMTIRNLACLVGVWSELKVFPLVFDLTVVRRVREMLSFSLYTYVTSFSNLVLKSGAVTIAGYFSQLASGPYNPARTLSNYFEDFTQQLQLVLPPLIGGMAGDVRRQGEVYIRLSRFVFFFASAVYFPLVLHLPELFQWWIPNLHMLDTAILVGQILLTKSLIAVVLISPAQAVMLMADRHRPVAAATTLSAVASCVLAIPGWHYYGLVGVAFAFTLGPMLGGGVLLPDGWRFAQVSFSSYFRRVLLPVLVGWVPLFGLLWWGVSLGYTTLAERVATSVVAGLVYVCCYLMIQREDREVLTNLYRRFRK